MYAPLNIIVTQHKEQNIDIVKNDENTDICVKSTEKLTLLRENETLIFLGLQPKWEETEKEKEVRRTRQDVSQNISNTNRIIDIEDPAATQQSSNNLTNRTNAEEKKEEIRSESSRAFSLQLPEKELSITEVDPTSEKANENSDFDSDAQDPDSNRYFSDVPLGLGEFERKSRSRARFTSEKSDKEVHAPPQVAKKPQKRKWRQGSSNLSEEDKEQSRELSSELAKPLKRKLNAKPLSEHSEEFKEPAALFKRPLPKKSGPRSVGASKEKQVKGRRKNVKNPIRRTSSVRSLDFSQRQLTNQPIASDCAQSPPEGLEKKGSKHDEWKEVDPDPLLNPKSLIGQHVRVWSPKGRRYDGVVVGMKGKRHLVKPLERAEEEQIREERLLGYKRPSRWNLLVKDSTPQVTEAEQKSCL